MPAKKVFVLCGHPNADSFSGALASAYEKSARAAGHSVRRMDVGAMHFDPVLHDGYKVVQKVEPDLLLFQENVKWADHLVFIYPSWWSAMPAVLKGLFDRAWLPGFAFNFDKTSKKPIQRLKGRTARFFVTAGAHAAAEEYWCACDDCRNGIERSLMTLAGIQGAITFFSETEIVTDQERRAWLKKVRALGRRGK